MTLDFQAPKTVDGVKRLAKRLRQQQGLRHARALDQAAQIAGFDNFIHAVRQLPATALAPNVRPADLSPPGIESRVTVGWRDREAGGSGMETATVRLSRSLDQLITPSLLRKAARLGDLRRVNEQHLAARTLGRSRMAARRDACQAARTLQFMDATGLRPSMSRRRVYPFGDYGKAIPGMDHPTTWYDPRAKAHLIADEPYRSGPDQAERRAAWAEQYGYVIVRTSGWGMYYPDGGCELYLIADASKGYDLKPLVAAVDALGAPMSQDPWNGLSQGLDLDLLWPS